MAKNRHAACEHCAPHSAHRPILEEVGYTAPPTAEPALTRLAEALNALHDPWRGALARLNEQDVADLLSLAPVHMRTYALRFLGLHLTPRTVPRALCRDILQRLPKRDENDVRHAIGSLAHPIRSAILRTMAHPCSPESGEQGSATLLSLTLWSSVGASAEGARALVWASGQPWWPGADADPDDVERVRQAAEHVVGVTPDFVHRMHRDLPVEPDQEPLHPHTNDAEEPHPVSTDPESLEASESLGTPDGTDDPAPPSLDALRPERADLDLLHREAIEALTVVGRALEGGHRVPSSELGKLVSYDAAFDRLASHLLGAADGPVTRISDLDDALGVLAAQVSETERIRGLLDLTDLPNVSQDQIRMLHDLVRDTTDLEEPTSTRVALTALSDLVDAFATEQGRDPARLFELQNRIVSGLPSELRSLPLAVMLRPAKGTTPGIEAKTAPLDPPLPQSEESVPEPSALSEEHTPSAPPNISEVPPGTLADRSAAGPEETSEHADSVQAADEVEATVAQLVTERRLSLAAVISATAEQPAHQVSAMRIAALAEALRTGTGACAARLRDEFATIDPDDFVNDTPTLLLTVPALIRAALVTGEPTAGALLHNAAPHLEKNLSAIARTVGQRALKGLLVGSPLGTRLADVSLGEERLSQATQEARRQLAPRNLKFRRATKLAQTWFAEKGLVGSLLTAAANDDRHRVAEITEKLVDLSRRENINKEIDRADAELRGSSSRPLQGTARNNLVTLVETALAAVSDWLDVVSALRRADEHEQAWATTDLAEMRAVVREHVPGALAALDARASERSLTDAVHVAAACTLRNVVDLLEVGTDNIQGEPLPEHVLTAELLRVTGVGVDPSTGHVSLPAGAGITELMAATTTGWTQALSEQIRVERYPTARHLLGLAEAGTLPGNPTPLPWSVREELESAERRSLDELTEFRISLVTALNRARLQQEVSEEQDGELSSLLDIEAPMSESDLAEVRAKLEAAEKLLPQYRREAADRLTDRLDTLVSRPTRVNVDEERIRSLIRDGALPTAEELIYFCEIDEPAPEPMGHHELPAFFPRVPDGLPKGITRKLIEIARAGGVVPGGSGLDFGGLSTDARDLVADTLTSWMDAGHAPPKQRNQISRRALLVQALRLIGYDVAPSAIFAEPIRAKGLDRSFFEFSKVTWNGTPLVPQFGSKLHNRLRVLVCWGQPGAELLRSWVDQDTSGDALLVAYLGTMSAQVRRQFAVQAVHSNAPVAVVDDAALAYLAASGARQLEAAMEVLLPFSAVQPYARHKRSLVPPEMFYGRDAERREVIDPEGTQVIFGGRGLGKSALLRSAKTAFEQEAERVAVHIELSTVAIGEGAQASDAVWDVLLRELRSVGVVSSAKSRKGGLSAYEQVRAGVLQWLSADSRRRLLILLDESDGFFEEDAPRFLETNRLKDLGQASGVEGRAKVVFAGLHSVQRFAKLSNNTFKHLAQRPTSIGHLRPRFAYDLITRPMRALGFTFGEEELIHRILGYCSYQPFLLQMFGNRLVRHMLDKRRSGASAQEPPYVITRADVECVETDAELRDDITETFRDTLHLDPRYNIIANVLAHHAYEYGLDVRLSERDLRDECLAYWQRGFDSLDSEAFRAYLNEMVGLGLLAANTDLRGWRLRSANALRMIGTHESVITSLVDADSESVPSESIALIVRRQLPGGRRAPLTTAQIDDLLGDHSNRVRLVLGSRATGISDVAGTVRAVQHDLGGRYDLQEPQDRRRFEEALVGGDQGQRCIVLSDLATIAPRVGTCLASLEAAIDHLPLKRGVTRAVVLVSAPEQTAFWAEVLAGTERPGLGLVRLRRHDKLSLKVWAMDTGVFTTAERQTRVLEVTGGWPLLVERAQNLAESSREKPALERLEQGLRQPQTAAAFVDEVGLTAHPLLSEAFEAIVQLVDDWVPYDDLIGAVELSGSQSDPRIGVDCLEALSVFEHRGDDMYRVEPLVARCWQHRRM